MHDDLTPLIRCQGKDTKLKKSVIVVGGSRGIGRDIVVEFAKAGYHVVVGARNIDRDAFPDVANVTCVQMDASNESEHQLLIDAAFQATDCIHAWVNNVGLSAWRPIGEIDDDFLSTMISTNLKSIFWGSKAAVGAMSENGGAIINISSIAGKRGSKNNSVYCACKFGVNGLTQSLAKEVGQSGITVNAICPVLIKTPGLMSALAHDFSPAANDPEAFIQRFTEANSATGKLPTGEDVGRMAVFIASPAAVSLTGQCLNLDCGVFPQ